MSKPVRRIVTGHDDAGKSIFLEVGAPPQFHPRKGRATDFHEFWNTNAMPAPISSVEDKDPNDRSLKLPPDNNGVIIRIVDFHPGNRDHLSPRADGRPPGMHRTRTIDYGIIIEGEIYLVLDDSEEKVGPGDIIIQRGTDHAWENRGETVCRVAFVLIDGVFTDELAAKLPEMELHVAPVSQDAQ